MASHNRYGDQAVSLAKSGVSQMRAETRVILGALARIDSTEGFPKVSRVIEQSDRHVVLAP
jgi:hypothetical protein